jgi:hypothetical protein
MICSCSLAVITERGRQVIPPSGSELAHDEEDFLQRHVDSLRADAQKDDTPRGRFRPGSTLLREFSELLAADARQFDAVATLLVDSLAKAMRGAPRARDCVVALLTSGGASEAEHVSLLKLDAEIEAARLEQLENGIRLRVFRDLLPRPGDLQKGLSWPDPRTGISEIIVKDRNFSHTAKYFQNAFGVDASPNALDTERAFVNALADSLSASEVAEALDLITDGGLADEVSSRVQQSFPTFRIEAPELGAGGALPGRIRRLNSRKQRKIFRADGIELRVPVERLSSVYTVEQDGGYETRINTTSPLTPIRGREDA